MPSSIQNKKINKAYLKVLLKKNDVDEAISAYKSFICQSREKKNNQKNIDKVCLLLGKIIFKLSVRKGQFDPVINFFKQAINDYPHKEWSYFNLGVIFSKQNNINEAIKCHKKANELRPKFYLNILKLGTLLLEKGEQNKAFKCGLEIINNQGNFKSRKSSKYLFRLLSSHSNQQKSQDAIKKAIEEVQVNDAKQREKVVTYLRMGAMLRNQGQLSEAIEYYNGSMYCSWQKLRPEYIDKYWDSGIRKDPDFLIVGFGKCGTTSLYDYLCQHPQVLPAIEKEPMYFKWLVKNTENIENVHLSSLNARKDLYLAHFAPRPEEGCFITGEASTTNVIPGVEKIVSRWFPNIKLIFLVREPVRRTVSHYEQRLKSGKQTQTLSEVINSELDKLEGVKNPSRAVSKRLSKGNGWGEHVAMSLYVYTIERWMSLFTKEQFLIVANEDLAQYPEKTMNQTFDFLGLPECDSIKYEPRNVGSYPQIDANLLSRLSKFFKPHNQRLEEFLGRKFNWD